MEQHRARFSGPLKSNERMKMFAVREFMDIRGTSGNEKCSRSFQLEERREIILLSLPPSVPFALYHFPHTSHTRA